MRLESARIANFRNHGLLEFEPGPGITVIHGRNGTGKTSILEAVHYCALTRGFAGSSDRECLAFGSDQFSIRASFSSDRGTSSEVRVSFTQEKEKQIFVNEQEVTLFSRHIGSIPCVTFTPPELSIVTGAPAERRRFLDSAICQYDRRYLDDLMQYRRILQQRNALLASGMVSSSDQALDIWTGQLALQAASIVMARMDFVSRFSVQFRKIYALFSGEQVPSIDYNCSLGKCGPDIRKEELAAQFLDRYEELRSSELMRRQTLAGPHRDDMRFCTDGHEIRKYASQGQQRSFLIAMKLALHKYLSEAEGELPVTLFDDLFSELDEDVSEMIIDSLSAYGQVIITSTVEKRGEGITLFSIDQARQARS